MRITKGDKYHKAILETILKEGTLDENPRAIYELSKEPANALSINHVLMDYNLTKNESPLITLRPIAVKKAIGEILWIYQDQSNDLDLLKDKYGVTWWDNWDIGDRTIGSCYGSTVKKYDLMNNLLKGLKEDPFGRRHIMSLWQEDDFKEPHALKPCCFMTTWNVRRGSDKKLYLDMILNIRSNDFMVAGCINQVQYLVLMHLVARHLGYEVGKFSVFVTNVQIYNAHFGIAKELLSRRSIECEPKIWINPEKTNFYDFTLDDIKIINYPMEKIKQQNPQVKFELAV